MVRIALLALVGTLALGVFAATASATATQRWASPTSTRTSGSCSSSAPCTFTWAIMGAAAGDEVIVQPGQYTISSQVKPSVAVNIHGQDGQPMPNIVEVAPMLKDGIDLGAGSSIRHMRIESTVPDRDALDLHGALGEDLVLVMSAPASGTAGHPPAAADLVSSVPYTVLRDTVAYATGAGAVAVLAKAAKNGTALDGTRMVNVTAVATGAGSRGVLVTMAGGSVEARNTIARGTVGDVTATVSGLTNLSYSNFRPAYSTGYVDGGGNQSADPLFADAASGDFHQLAGSPTVDAGAASPLSGADDPDGTIRPLGAAPDMGAFELVPSGVGGGGTTTTPPLPGQQPPAPTAEPGATAAGAGTGTDGTPGARAAAPVPELGAAVVMEPIHGTVSVLAPGASKPEPLVDGARVPVGSVIDATHGTVDMTAVRDRAGTTQSGRFWGGAFVVEQRRSGDLTTEIKLRGGSRSGCSRQSVLRAAAVAGSTERRRRRRVVRQLWGNDNHGRFSTHGANAVATVRGTTWLTQDRCNGTLVRVRKGRVDVADLVRHRTVKVTAGHAYFARARRAR